MSARAWAHPIRTTRWAFISVLAVIGVAIVASAILFVFRPPGTGFFFFPFGWVIFLLFFLFFWGFRWRWGWYGRPYGLYPGDGAKAILRERYARGEIGKDQFDEMMRDLDQRP